MAISYRLAWPKIAKQWDEATLVRRAQLTAQARKIVAAKGRYAAVAQATGVPWYWIGPTHVRESDMDWGASLAQGDPWRRVSVHKPAGRGPFASWEAAAIDALQLDGLTRVIDWRLEKLLYYWELYNGFGPRNHGVPSSYVWAGTSIQKPGKYVRDGVWSSTTTDMQPGCAGILKVIMELDPTVRPKRED